MIMFRISFYVVLIIPHFILGQTPCEDGFAGEYPCSGYKLLGHVPVTTLANNMGAPAGNDVWGWTDPETGKEYAIAGTTNSTAFVDISDPINPVFLGRMDTENGQTNYWRDVKTYNDHAFVVADNVGDHGMQVFDLTRLRDISSPTTFNPDAVYSDVESCHNIVINEASSVAYLVGCPTSFNGGIHFVDISDPKNPVGLGGHSSDGYTHDAQVITYNGPDIEHQGKEIFIGSNENNIVILDVSNKENVSKISDFTYTQIGYTHQGWFTDDHRYFLLGDELDEMRYGNNTRILIFDLENLENPIQLEDYIGQSEAIDHNGYVKGDYFFMASYRAGMRVLDISEIGKDQGQILEAGYFDTYPENNGTNFNGAWSVYPYFPSGNIIINDIERGLFIVGVSDGDGDNKLTLNLNPNLNVDYFTISPNPSNTNTIITALREQKIETVKVINFLGQPIFREENINKRKFVFDLNNRPSGIYIIKINEFISKKLKIY